MPHDHSHDHEEHADDGPTSTGFLPLSLAVALFVTGVFSLGWVQCEPTFDEQTPHDAALE